MGFYAKGSPDAFLHLTTDAGDATKDKVTDDTIFHSSLPHVFIEKEWEIPVTPFGSKIDWSSPKWDWTLRKDGGWSTKPGGQLEFNGTFYPPVSYLDNVDGIYKGLDNFKDRLSNSNMFAVLPKDLQDSLHDTSSVLLFQLVFDISGIEYYKYISGLTYGSSGNLYMDRHQTPDGYGTFRTSGNMSLLTNLAIGVGYNIGFFNYSGADPLKDACNKYNYGSCAYKVVFKDKGEVIRSGGHAAKDKHLKEAMHYLLSCIYTSKYGSAADKINLSEWIGGNKVPSASSYNAVYIASNTIKSTVSETDGAGDIEYKVDSMFRNRNYYSYRINLSWDDKMFADHQKSSAASINRNCSFPLSTYTNKFEGKHTSSMLETIPYRELPYNKSPTKLRVIKLHMGFTKDNGYFINNNPSVSDGIHIGNGIFRIKGTDFTSNKIQGMLYQLNKNGNNNRRDNAGFVNHSYSSTNIPSPGLFITESATNNNVELHKLGGNLSPDNSFSVCSTKLEGKGWSITNKNIGDKRGIIWDNNNIPLTLMNNATKVITFGGMSGSGIDMQDKTHTIKHETISLGLNTTRPTTVVFKLSSSDNTALINNIAWFALGEATDSTHHMNTEANHYMETPHSILVLPIKQYVPIISSLSTNRHFTYTDIPNSYQIYNYASTMDICYWLYNNGDGNLSIYSSHASYTLPNLVESNIPSKHKPIYDIPYNHTKFPSDRLNKAYIVPKFTMYITKLS